jgi:multiple sugar transport system substrate-binding protein
LKNRGISDKFDVFEDVVAAIYKTTFTRPNGDVVHGFAKQGRKSEVPFSVGMFFRTKGAEWLDENMKPTFTDPRVLEAINLYKDLFEKKVLPSNFTALANKDVIDLIKAKRVAFTLYGPDYSTRFVGEDGLTWDDVGFMNQPAAREYKSQYPDAAPTLTFQWAFVVPKNAKNVEMSWNFLRHISSKDGVLNQALSGNNPVRASVYDMPEYRDKVHFVDVIANVFKYGHKLFPGFDNFAEVRDTIGEEIQRAVLGEKSAKQAMEDAQKKAAPLLP